MLKKAAVAATAIGLPLAFASPAMAAESFQGNLSPLNDSGVSGTAMVTLDGNTATVTVNTSGVVPGVPHAQHIHIGGTNECPTMADDADGDGILSTVEGKPAYGAIRASLTTEGDTSPSSALAVKRFPTASDGSVSYSRTFDVDAETAQNIRDGGAVIVQHGIDANGNGKYDDSAGGSQLSDKLPLEATAPNSCGELTAAQVGAAPGGGAQTGGGSTAGIENEGLFALGALGLLGAVGAVVVSRRRETRSEG